MFQAGLDLTPITPAEFF